MHGVQHPNGESSHEGEASRVHESGMHGVQRLEGQFVRRAQSGGASSSSMQGVQHGQFMRQAQS
eukprot:11744859-Alexandrium_andersonii.AAC.1